jgi:hypothetical protein
MSDRRIAKQWGTDERTVRRWRSKGAPLDPGDEDKLRLWLLGRRYVPKGTAAVLRDENPRLAYVEPPRLLPRPLPRPPRAAPPPAPATPATPTAPAAGGADEAEPDEAQPQRHRGTEKTNGNGEPPEGAEGAAANLKRLEQEELRLFREMEQAADAGNVVTLSSARLAWLKVSESLRKADLAVEAARRDSGTLVPREDAEAFVCGALVNGFGSLGAALEALCPRLAGLPDPQSVWGLLGAAWKQAAQSAISNAAARPYGGKNLPSWLVRAIEEAKEANL